MTNNQKIALVIWFYIGWFGCVFFAKWNMPIWSLAFPLVPFLLFFKFKIYNISQLFFLLALSIIGIIADFIFYKFGLIKFLNYNYTFVPVWLIAIWFLFSTVFLITHPIFKDRWTVAGLLGGIFGPISYYSGEAFQVMSFTHSLTFYVYAIFWGLYFPGLHYFYRKFEWK